MINFAAVGRRAPIDVSTAGIFCAFGDNFQTAAPDDEEDGASVAVAGCATSSLVFATNAEVRECARPTEEGIHSLDNDVHDQFVYRDPVPLQIRYDQIIANEKKYGDSFPKSADYLKNKAALKAELDVLNARGGKLTQEQLDAQVAFSTAWTGFRNNWAAFYDDRVVGPDADPGKAEADQVSAYDDEFRQYVDQFVGLGGKVTFVPPKPGGKASPVDWEKYVKWGLVVGGIVAAAYLLSDVTALVRPRAA